MTDHRPAPLQKNWRRYMQQQPWTKLACTAIMSAMHTPTTKVLLLLYFRVIEVPDAHHAPSAPGYQLGKLDQARPAIIAMQQITTGTSPPSPLSARVILTAESIRLAQSSSPSQNQRLARSLDGYCTSCSCFLCRFPKYAHVTRRGLAFLYHRRVSLQNYEFVSAKPR